MRLEVSMVRMNALFAHSVHTEVAGGRGARNLAAMTGLDLYS